MEAVKKIIRSATADEVTPLLSLACADDVQGIGLQNVIAGCQFFMLEDGSFAYALTDRGNELWVQAAGGHGAQDLTGLGLAVIEAQAAGRFRSVGFQTRRRGLVRKACAHGYIVDGYILRKHLV